MSLVITGATGHFGRLVVEELLARGVPAQDIVATGRAIEKTKDLADRGVRVRAADYADPASMRAAFEGASGVLLVSGMAPDRAQQHRDAIDAARDAGVGLIAYSSIVNATKTTMRVADDHKATETALRASGVPFVALRNSWYIENYTAQLPVML
ncbi:MAG: NAD(P)H-binding protein, partial [Actinocrinis sp.]